MAQIDQKTLDEQIQAVSKLLAISLAGVSATDMKSTEVAGQVRAFGTCGTFGTLTDTFGTFGSYSLQAEQQPK